MRQTKFTQEQVMFTLAMISYRGFQYLGEGRFSDERLRDAVEDALERLEPVKEQWELVWGPATYRAPFTLFADSAMYVVRSRKKPSRYVVAIRGTNPLSLFDWVFGDLLTGKVTPWRYGNPAAFPEAAISLSTSLGLSILQNLRSSPPSRGLLADIWRLVDRNLVDPLSEIARNVVRPLGAVLEDAFLRLQGGIQQDLRALAARDRPASTDLDVAIEAIRSERRSRLRKRIRREIAKTLKKGSGEGPLNPLRLTDRLALAMHFKPGLDVRSFLAGRVEEARKEGRPPLEIIVTGHSKGGALAPALALWLADTQGEGNVEERWDPSRDATIHCFSFAGPTPGNEAFAQHYDAVIGARSHRISNKRDVVPNAWAVSAAREKLSLHLRKIPAIYSSVVKSHPKTSRQLARLVDEIAKEVAPLHYTHVGTHVTEFDGKLDAGKTLFVEQAVHQHVKGYIQHLGLEGKLDLIDLLAVP